MLDIGGAGAFGEAQAAESRVFHLATGYRMYYTGRDTAGVNALGVATSPDGFVDADGWHLWHGVERGGSSSLHYMASTDGLAWTDGPSNPVLGRNPDLRGVDRRAMSLSSVRVLVTGRVVVRRRGRDRVRRGRRGRRWHRRGAEAGQRQLDLVRRHGLAAVRDLDPRVG